MKLLGAVLWLLAIAGAYTYGSAAGAGEPASNSGSAAVRQFEDGLGERNPVRRSFELSRALRAIDATGIADAVRAVEEAGFWFDRQEHHLLMAAWVPIDSITSEDWAFARPGTLTQRARIAWVDALGFHNPAQARSLVSSLDLSEQAQLLHLHMVQGWARSERKESLTSYLESLPQGLPRQQSTKALINEILKAGPEELIAWVDTIPIDAERQFKRVAFQKSVISMARVSPERAARWLDEGSLGRRAAGNSHKLVAMRWLERDPASAMDWLAASSEGDEGRDLVKQTFLIWMKIDNVEAQGWVRASAPAPGVDPAVRVLVRRYFDRRPDKAMEWAHRIQNREMRLRVLASAGRAWLRADSDAFMAWLPDSGLEKQVRDLILNTKRKTAAPTDWDAGEE